MTAWRFSAAEIEGRVPLRLPLADPTLGVRPCACGLSVVADTVDPTLGVRAHQRLPQHRDWREREGL